MINAFSVKNAILVMLLIGFWGGTYVIGSSIASRTGGGLDNFAVGAMRKFETVSQPPEQPNLPLTLSDGSQIRLSDKRGKILLVNFWATWCAPCVVEMPMLNELQARRGSDAFEVVAVSMDTTRDVAEEFYLEHQLNDLTLYHDEQFRMAMIASPRGLSRGLPLTVLYDPHGEELGRLNGEADWSSDEALALIDAAIERYGVAR
jgi:thiol-disulfide isomerase/thioredoxin